MKAKVFLPDYVGYGPAVGLIVLLMLAWYYAVKSNERTGRFSAN
jgi:hypothetical protein